MMIDPDLPDGGSHDVRPTAYSRKRLQRSRDARVFADDACSTMNPQTVGDATHDVDKTMRRLRVVLMCMVGYVGLWDVAVTFGPLGVASHLAGRGDIQCNSDSSRDGQIVPDNDRWWRRF